MLQNTPQQILSNKFSWKCRAFLVHIINIAVELGRRPAMGDAASFGSCSIQDGREDYISENAVANMLPMNLWSIIISRIGRTVDLMASASVDAIAS